MLGTVETGELNSDGLRHVAHTLVHTYLKPWLTAVPIHLPAIGSASVYIAPWGLVNLPHRCVGLPPRL